MKFTKMHGAGNDYLFIDAREIENQKDWSSVAISMSDRHFGVGSDGIILAANSDQADLRMVMLNADGTEGEMCGNGIRCLAAFSYKLGFVPKESSKVVVETLGGNKTVTPIWDGPNIVRAIVQMGKPNLRTRDLPAYAPGNETLSDFPLEIKDQIYLINGVSMGNPHAVAFLDQPVGDVPLHEIGPLVENHDMFPKRVNFEIVNVVDSSHVQARVWERGSGETMACGSGACAISVAGRIKGFTGDEVQISLPGGDLMVKWEGKDSEVVMEGPVEEVFVGEWPD